MGVAIGRCNDQAVNILHRRAGVRDARGRIAEIIPGPVIGASARGPADLSLDQPPYRHGIGKPGIKNHGRAAIADAIQIQVPRPLNRYKTLGMQIGDRRCGECAGAEEQCQQDGGLHGISPGRGDAPIFSAFRQNALSWCPRRGKYTVSARFQIQQKHQDKKPKNRGSCHMKKALSLFQPPAALRQLSACPGRRQPGRRPARRPGRPRRATGDRGPHPATGGDGGNSAAAHSRPHDWRDRRRGQ